LFQFEKNEYFYLYFIFLYYLDPGKKLPFYLSIFYKIDDNGNYDYKEAEEIIHNDKNVINNKGKLSEEDLNREIMLSNNKKKLL
jgi:hypothetical protein